MAEPITHQSYAVRNHAENTSNHFQLHIHSYRSRCLNEQNDYNRNRRFPRIIVQNR